MTALAGYVTLMMMMNQAKPGAWPVKMKLTEGSLKVAYVSVAHSDNNILGTKLHSLPRSLNYYTRSPSAGSCEVILLLSCDCCQTCHCQ